MILLANEHLLHNLFVISVILLMILKLVIKFWYSLKWIERVGKVKMNCLLLNGLWLPFIHFWYIDWVFSNGSSQFWSNPKVIFLHVFVIIYHFRFKTDKMIPEETSPTINLPQECTNAAPETLQIDRLQLTHSESKMSSLSSTLLLGDNNRNIVTFTFLHSKVLI